MAKQLVNTGPTVKDSLKAGAIKINENFNELYSSLGNGTNLRFAVDIPSTPLSGQTLQYNASTGKFVAATISGGSGVGTVTSVSVTNANGFAGTVATASSTPAITITTGISGVLKGNGTAISAATAGTDYQAPITLTTTGSSGAATFSGNTLNIPQYVGSGGSGTVTSVGGSGTVNGLTLTGTVTTSGSLTLGGTLSNVSLTSAVTGILPQANGGNGTASPGLVQGTNITITGTWPTQTINATATSSSISWSISAADSSNYTFTGPGIVADNTTDPVLYLYKGFTYTFVNTTGSMHPFAIRSSNGGANYTSGVSGSQSGTQTFIVPMNAPSTLYYQCTIHSVMGNTINIV